jgi:DNA-binding PadR family transcriptional regulator
MSDMDMSTALPTAPLHILLALSEGSLHGYGILQAVRERSAGTVKLGTGSLYRHLSKLIAAGLVAETAPKASADPRRGSSYRLTPRGRQALTAERDRVAALLASLNAAARRIRGGSV